MPYGRAGEGEGGVTQTQEDHCNATACNAKWKRSLSQGYLIVLRPTTMHQLLSNNLDTGLESNSNIMHWVTLFFPLN